MDTQKIAAYRLLCEKANRAECDRAASGHAAPLLELEREADAVRDAAWAALSPEEQYEAAGRPMGWFGA